MSLKITERQTEQTLLNTRLQGRDPHGRSVSCWPSRGTILKVALITLAFLTTTHLMAQSIPKVTVLSTSASIRSFPLRQWPEDLHYHVMPGSVCDDTGSYCCITKNISFTFRDCTQLTRALRDYPLPIFNNYRVQTNPPIEIIVSNPLHMHNYEQTLDYLKTTFLEVENPFLVSSQQILESIRQTHRLCSKGISPKELRGKYRNPDPLFVYFLPKDGSDPRMDRLVAHLRETGTPEQEIKEFAAAYEKATLRGENFGQKEAIYLLTAAEKAALDKVGTFLLSGDNVAESMERFAKQLTRLIAAMPIIGIDPVELAAWTHQKLMYIFPFGEGSIEVARGWMNLILQLGGYEAVSFPSDSDYWLALHQVDNVHGFAQLLRGIIEERDLLKRAATT